MCFEDFSKYYIITKPYFGHHFGMFTAVYAPFPIPEQQRSLLSTNSFILVWI